MLSYAWPVPHTNPRRRRDLADAAIALLASSGVHGLTHRAAENAAGLPPGTASNYFRSREALLIAAAERIAELHHADTDHAAQQHQDTAADPAGRPAAGPGDQVADLLAGSLLAATTIHRDRYLAVVELLLEARRRPALAAALAGMQEIATGLTAGLHARLGLPIPASAVPVLIALYEGALFALLTAPAEHATEQSAGTLARAIVHGALPGWPDSGGPAGRPGRPGAE
jgi:AcrR family transcriptional regulator